MHILSLPFAATPQAVIFSSQLASWLMLIASVPVQARVPYALHVGTDSWCLYTQQFNKELPAEEQLSSLPTLNVSSETLKAFCTIFSTDKGLSQELLSYKAFVSKSRWVRLTVSYYCEHPSLICSFPFETVMTFLWCSVMCHRACIKSQPVCNWCWSIIFLWNVYVYMYFFLFKFKILIFPEGTCTNRSCLITFKQGERFCLIIVGK